MSKRKMHIDHIPPEFARSMEEVYGERGTTWIADLPSLLESLAERWSLAEVLPPFEPLSYNYAAPAILADGTDAVLKVGVPNSELLSEMAALKVYDGEGACRLLAHDPDAGAMLLERVLPGEMLHNLEDDHAETEIAARLMKQLWKRLPQEHPFPSLERWTRGITRIREAFDGGTGPFPEHLVVAAERLRGELLQSQGERVLLHGDLHHYNILSAIRQPWLALDPKGVAGDPVNEVATFMLNPLHRLPEIDDLESLFERRASQFAEILGFDRQRILAWSLVHGALSAWWTYEDHGRVGELALRAAGVLQGMV